MSLVGAVGSSIPVRPKHVPRRTVSLSTTGWQALALYDASPNLQGESSCHTQHLGVPKYLQVTHEKHDTHPLQLG